MAQPIDHLEPQPQPPMPSERSRRASLFRRVFWTLLVVAVAMAALAHRKIAAGFNMGLALRAYEQGELARALHYVDAALRWTPARLGYYLFRARLRAENDDLQGALADYTRIIQRSPRFARAYLGRMLIYQRMGRYHQAVADAEQALKHWPRSDDPQPWNTLAYARALANENVAQGLKEVERALQMAQQKKPPDPLQLSAYLDTRAFLLYRLQRYEEALADLDRALRLFNPWYESFRQALHKRKDLPEQARNSLLQELDHHLAVLLHHRGLILQALGHKQEAETHLERARRLGYDPRKGVQ